MCHTLSCPFTYLQQHVATPANTPQAPHRSVLTSVQILAALCPLWGWKSSSPQAGRLRELHHPSPSVAVCNAKGNTTLGGREKLFPGQKGRKGGAFSVLKIQVLSRGEEISMFPAEEEVGSNTWQS